MEKTKDINVLHIIDHMGLGGVQRILVGLVKNGYGNIIIANRKKGEIIEEIPANIELFYGGKTPLAAISSTVKTHKLIRQKEINIVHCFLSTGVFIGLILALLNKNVRFFFHEQGDILNGNPGYKQILKWASRYGNVIACSDYMRKTLKKTIPGIEPLMIPNFINHDYFFPDIVKGKAYRNILGINESRKVIGFAGRLTNRKGWKYLLEAYLNLDRDDLVLLIAGTGEEENKIRQMINDRDIVNIVLLNQEKNMRGFYNALDIFVMPSLVEPFGLTQLEAQACGIPVIASNIEGINETIDQTNAILVKPGDAENLQTALSTLLNNCELELDLKTKGLENAQDFTAQHFILRVSSLINS
ncbi:MAG: glycosyltransferase family 4 protein [Anaerolineaceae bacterium]|nr:glycosyltransferase family 4 protein [Anaerolineaceae bacterium]